MRRSRKGQWNSSSGGGHLVDCESRCITKVPWTHVMVLAHSVGLWPFLFEVCLDSVGRCSGADMKMGVDTKIGEADASSKA
eukprot:358824-Chlamydomonas_euryale.AAC.2